MASRLSYWFVVRAGLNPPELDQDAPQGHAVVLAPDEPTARAAALAYLCEQPLPTETAVDPHLSSEPFSRHVHPPRRGVRRYPRHPQPEHLWCHSTGIQYWEEYARPSSALAWRDGTWHRVTPPRGAPAYEWRDGVPVRVGAS